jgi:hypothetical protein
MPGTAELDDVSRSRPPEVVLERHVHDDTGAEDQDQEQIHDPLAIDPAQIALHHLVPEVERDHRGEREAQEVAHAVVHEQRPPLLAQVKPAAEEQAGDEDIDAGKYQEKQGRSCEQGQNGSTTSQF